MGIVTSNQIAIWYYRPLFSMQPYLTIVFEFVVHF